MKNIFHGVVVLYNPEMTVLENIESYIDDVEILYVIDNSTEKNYAVIERIKENKKCIYVDNNGNQGIALALNSGAKMAMERKAFWLLTMDQDSSFASGDLRKMIRWITENRTDDVGIVSPKHGESQHSFKYYNLITMTSGNLLNLKIHKNIGGFDDKLFIDGVDTDYCLKLTNNGYKIHRFPVLLNHKLGNTRKFKIWNFKAHPTNHSALRRYYITRNRFYLWKKYRKSNRKFIRWEQFQTAKEMIKVILFEKEKIKKFIFSLRGYFDYKRNKLGQYFPLENWNYYFFGIILLLILIAGFRPVGLDKDSVAYVAFLTTPFINADFMDMEISFWIINELNRIIFSSNERSLLLIYAIIGVSLKAIVVYKYSDKKLLSLYTYIGLFFIFQEMTTIRAGVAIGFLFLSVKDIIDRNLKNFFIKYLLAVFFHYSALFFIFIFLLNPKKINRVVYFFIPVLGIIFMQLEIIKDFVYNIAIHLPSFLSAKILSRYDPSNIEALTKGRVLSIGNIFMLLLLYFHLFFMDRKNSTIIFVKMLSIGFLILFSFSYVEVFAYRLANYMFFTLVFLIPLTIEKVKFKKTVSVLIFGFLSYSLIKNSILLLDLEKILR